MSGFLTPEELKKLKPAETSLFLLRSQRKSFPATNIFSKRKANSGEGSKCVSRPMGSGMARKLPGDL